MKLALIDSTGLFPNCDSFQEYYGSEFAHHERISKELNTDFYFAHPYSSWERGLNENTNGLVRQYLKKDPVSCMSMIRI